MHETIMQKLSSLSHRPINTCESTGHNVTYLILTIK